MALERFRPRICLASKFTEGRTVSWKTRISIEIPSDSAQWTVAVVVAILAAVAWLLLR